MNVILPNSERYFPQDNMTLYAGKGCPSCSGIGYKGRIGLFEFIVMTPELHDLILKSPSAQDIWKLVRSQGTKSLFEDGVEKVKSGITTLDELMRVAAPPKES